MKKLTEYVVKQLGGGGGVYIGHKIDDKGSWYIWKMDWLGLSLNQETRYIAIRDELGKNKTNAETMYRWAS